MGKDKSKKKFFANFPYPYMNGALHLGHGFTLCKTEFAVRYQRLKGKQTLYPFGFHCTGMPIAACAGKIQREIAAYGNPPIFPEATQKPIQKKQEKKEEQKKGRGKGKIAKKKSKMKYQCQIMQEMGVPEELIPKFQNSKHWLHYFPPTAIVDLKRLGIATDWRRSFITTSENPYYDAFIRRHFNTLQKRN